VTLSLDHGVELPYAHPSVAGVRALAGVLAPRESWSERDLARLTRRFATRAAEELHQTARFDRAERWHGELLLLVIIVACLIKLIYWFSLDRRKGRSTPQSATGLGVLGRVRSFERPNVIDNYVMREMAFQIARKHAVKLRRIALAAGYLAPALLTVAAAVLPRWPATGCALLAASAAMFGVLVERWLFFAEAKHAVTLYYGAESA